MRLMLVAIAVTLLVVVAAGCGGKKKSAPPATTASSSMTTSQATTTSASTTTAATTTTAAAPTFASTKNCAQLVALGSKIEKAMQASSTGGASLSDEANLMKAFAHAAPSDIRGDFETFATAFASYAAALQKAGYKPGKVPTASQIAALTAASKTFSSTKVALAEQHLTAWSQKNCGGLVGATTTTGG